MRLGELLNVIMFLVSNLLFRLKLLSYSVSNIFRCLYTPVCLVSRVCKQWEAEGQAL